MKIYFAIAVSLLLILSVYEINMEEDAIRNIKMEINDVKIAHLTPNLELTIYVKLINNGKREIKGMDGYFTIFISNSSVGKAYLKNISIKAKSSYNATIPLKIYYGKVAEAIVNAIKEGKINISIRGKIKGKIFFGLIKYTQNIEAKLQ